MPNRLTRIPTQPVPRLPGPVQLLVPLADAFMIAMVSRPATGSLRTTWVTPATRWLSAAAALIALVAVMTLHPPQLWLAIIALVGFVFVIVGSAAVAVIAVCQNRAPR